MIKMLIYNIFEGLNVWFHSRKWSGQGFYDLFRSMITNEKRDTNVLFGRGDMLPL